MRVTEVRIRKMKQDGNRMKAVCSVTFDDVFVVHDIKVVEGERGLFVLCRAGRPPQGSFVISHIPLHLILERAFRMLS